MNNSRYSLTNLPTSLLLTILEERAEELEKLKKVFPNKNLLKRKINYLELRINVIKSVIIEKYLNDNITLTECSKNIKKMTGIKRDVFKEIFTIKLMKNKELIDTNLLKETIDKLDLDQIQMIMHSEQDISVFYATQKFDEMIFDVDKEVYDEYLLKKKMDRKEGS